MDQERPHAVVVRRGEVLVAGEDLERPEPEEEDGEDRKRHEPEDRDPQRELRRQPVGLLDPRIGRQEPARRWPSQAAAPGGSGRRARPAGTTAPPPGTPARRGSGFAGGSPAAPRGPRTPAPTR